MKKTIILMLALSMLCSMTACGNDSSSSEKEKATTTIEFISEPEINSEENSETESVVVKKKTEPDTSKLDDNNTEESEEQSGSDEDEISDNFLDIIPLAEPKYQVSDDGTINDATIADSLDEGIKAFEALDAYSKVVIVDDDSTFDSLKEECDSKALIAVTFDVTELLDYETEDYYYDFELNGIKYHLELGSANNTRWDIAYTYFAENDKNTTVIGKPEFKNNSINILPYAVNIGEMYVPDEDPVPTEYVVAYTPTFSTDYAFDEINGSSIYYIIREGKLFTIDWTY
ncbi:MAG: hypothetical protein IJ571_00150 [Ruminococcus sp.]|nr:hypothetical protein [Ruminococcus sp.]